MPQTSDIRRRWEVATHSLMGRDQQCEKQLPGESTVTSWEVEAQIKRKCRNAYEKREKSGGKVELINLKTTKLYKKGHLYLRE